jgi:23S rRNA maturation-related 3'-5' exoribonuclease YhaM
MMERSKLLSQYLHSTDFFEAPASAAYHLNTPGGLATHSTHVFINLLQLTSQLGLKWQDDESPFIIAFGHDVCKCGLYLRQPDGSYTHNHTQPEGHGQLSLDRIHEAGIVLTEEESACIRWHMGAFDDRDNWNKFTDAIHKFPNVLWTHTADMMAAHMDEV